MSDEKTVEREIKFAEVDHDSLRNSLADLEAEKQGPPSLEDNWIFDSNGSLAALGSILRLRVDRRGSRLTFKGPATFEGMVKIRDEHETGIADVDRMRSILEALGYSMVQRYQKYREEWMLGSIVISLDHTPIGDFAEFEGVGCETVARRTGLDPEKAERRNYLRLYEDYREDHPESPVHMTFP